MMKKAPGGMRAAGSFFSSGPCDDRTARTAQNVYPTDKNVTIGSSLIFDSLRIVPADD
jgi:hypothetical protein